MLCSGGDIITDYFINPLIKEKRKWKLKNNKHLSTYVVSFGISFPNKYEIDLVSSDWEKSKMNNDNILNTKCCLFKFERGSSM